ncbi:MAG: mechanosensitive ion channel family protein [Acholeplasmataceae bacterium]|nr:mechanosensitive ion channel family protein [Acholeplasmataceae bacterium]
MKFKEKSKKEKVQIIVVAVIIFIFLFLGMFSSLLFQGTTFAQIINSSVGKFFNLIDFFSNNYVIVLESVTIIIFVWIINRLLQVLVPLLTRQGQRSETIGKLMSSVIKYIIVLVAVFLILSAWGVQTPTLLAGAGILGLAISFGAQSLIEDIFCGLFIIFEKQFSVGDVIQISGMRGTVIEIGLRITKIQDKNGDTLIINNSDIRGAINTSSELSQSICLISISYSEDLEKVEKLIIDNLKEIGERIDLIKKGPFYTGVESLADSSVVLRILARCHELDKYKVARSMNREFKLLFDKNNIEIPFPQLVVHQEEE